MRRRGEGPWLNSHFYAWAVPFVWVIGPEIAKRVADIKLAQTSTRISPDSVDPRIKNYHWGDMTRALFEALDEGFDTTVLLDGNGFVAEVDISSEEFLNADEIFTATTGGGPVVVTRVNHRIFGNDAPGEVTTQIIKTYWDWHKTPR